MLITDEMAKNLVEKLQDKKWYNYINIVEDHFEIFVKPGMESDKHFFDIIPLGYSCKSNGLNPICIYPLN
jgi:hypothetical protein